MFCIAALVVSIYHLSLCSCSRPLSLFGSVSSDAWEALLDASHGRARGKTAVHACSLSEVVKYSKHEFAKPTSYSGSLWETLDSPATTREDHMTERDSRKLSVGLFFGSPVMLTVKKHTTTIW